MSIDLKLKVNKMFPHLNLYGYFTGWIIAIVTVALAVYAGATWQKHFNTPRPCIANYHSQTFPVFGKMEQEFIENTDPYPVDSELAKGGYKSPNEFMKAVVAMSADSKWPTEIYVNPGTGKEFIVPGLCYVGEIDSFGDPILYWGEKK